MLFLIEDEDGEKFGYYLDSQIEAKYNQWISTTSKTFHFTLQTATERLSKPMKFEINDISEGGYWLSPKSNDNLIGIGNIWIMKDRIGKVSKCYQYSFTYPDIENVLCGKETFIPKHILVIQME